jgi:hypothetical protein
MGTGTPTTTESERSLLEFGRSLSRYGAVAPRPEFRARLRASLLAAPVVLASRPSLWGWSFALRPAIVAFLVLTLLAAAGGGAAAAASSLPGDPAFALRRAVEDVQVALAPDELARAEALVAQSDRRLADLETLSTRRSSAVAVATEEYLAALARLEASLARVASLPATSRRDAALDRAETTSADHLARLEALAERLPDAAQHGIQRAIEVQEKQHGMPGNVPGSGIENAPGSAIEKVPGEAGRPGVKPGRPLN